MLHQLIDRYLRVVDQGLECADDLGHIVGWYRRCHTDSDTHGTVAQQVRKTRGQNAWLFQTFVVVWPEIDRFLVQIREHGTTGTGKPGLGVPHGCRWIAVNRTKVALPVDQLVSHPEILRQMDKRRVDNCFAVRMVVTGCMSGDVRTLTVLSVGL